MKIKRRLWLMFDIFQVIHVPFKKSGRETRQCDVCNKLFTDKRMLKVHKESVHMKIRPYLCNFCGYSASSRSSLKMHTRQHTGRIVTLIPRHSSMVKFLFTFYKLYLSYMDTRLQWVLKTHSLLFKQFKHGKLVSLNNLNCSQTNFLLSSIRK